MTPRAVLGLPFFPQQWQAVSAPIGPVLVLAGPGAGKTRCLTGRIGYLLQEGTDARRVCAITFTNKAAQEIGHRLRCGLGDAAADLTLGTIHSLCLRLVRQYYHRVGLPANFGVADEDQQRLVLSRLGVHSQKHRGLLTRFGRRRLDRQALGPAEEDLFNRYCRELRSHHVIDFDEILFLALVLLKDSARVLAECRARWDHLLIDEFQDLDSTQYEVLRLLAWEHRSLFAVGDDEQSIFAFRGADPQVLRRFAADFGIEAPIVLDVNCRCSRTIFSAARRVLPQDAPLFAKDIAAVRDVPLPVQAFSFSDDRAEAEWIVRDLAWELHQARLPRGEVAILYRNHRTGERLEEALITAGIPCRMGKGQALRDDPVIAQLLASLRIVLWPGSDLCVEQLARKLLSEELLVEAAQQRGETCEARLRLLAESAGKLDVSACWKFLYQVENLRGLRRLHGSLHDLVYAVLEQGIGRLEGPLEARHAALDDPENCPGGRDLAALLGQVLGERGRILLEPLGGLEVPVKVMLNRALPELQVEYRLAVPTPRPADRVLALGPIGPRLRIVEIFKALQAMHAGRFRKSFTNYTAFDTETTGTDPDNDEIIELAAVRVRDGRVVETFHTLVRPGRPVSAGAQAVHGYCDLDLAGQPTFAEVWPRFRAFVGDDLLVAHNGHRFDVPLLRRQAARCGGVEGLSFLDTLPMARSLYPVGGLGLEALAAKFGVPRGRGHHALDDSRCLVDVFEALQAERLARARKTCLGSLLDCVFLGHVLEGRPPSCPEDQAVVDASRWRDLRRRPAVVDAYVEEVEKYKLPCPPLEELMARIAAPGGWRGNRGEAELRDRFPESHERLERLLGLVRSSGLEEALSELLDRAALSTSDGPDIDSDRVSLLTFHATKGLEFARVYLAGVEDEVLSGAQATPAELAEARRLLYVAMTRAKDRLTLTLCSERHDRPGGGRGALEAMGLTAQPAPFLESPRGHG